MTTRRRFGASLLLAPLAAAPIPAARAAEPAAAFPARPVRLIVPTPAGGSFDGLARFFGEKLAATWKQPVIIENKPGAATMLAAAQVAKSAPDGYTLLFGTSAVAQNPSLYAKMPYEPGELAAVAKLHEIPLALAVNTSLGVGTLAKFIEHAKASKRPLSCGVISTTAQALGKILEQAAGIELISVPYKGEAPALTDLLGSQVDATFISAGTAAAQAGRLQVLAVASAKRLAHIVQVPTFAELGLVDLRRSGWGGVFAPAGTPRAVIESLSAAWMQAATSADVAEKTDAAGYVVDAVDGRAFAGFVDAETGYWRGVFKQFGIKAD
ncbi:MAG: tripartite tricarboxylate transporter substrate binding protein [Rubrivivax sp.]